jgi:hypothetical protein
MPVGIFNTSQQTTDSVKKSFSSLITRLAPNGSAPLFGITSMLKEETAYQFEHGYFSKTMVFPSMVMSGTQLNTDTTWTNVTDTTNVIPGMVFRNDRTGENVLINTVPSATSVTVARAFGTVAAAAINNADKWYMVGNAFEEASLRPASLTIAMVRITNYTQIFRNTWAVSGTNAATDMIAGQGNMAESRNECALFHSVDIEKALLFGQKFLGTKNSQPIHAMDGVINIVTVNAAGNVTTLGSTTTYTQLEAALDPAFNQVTDVQGPPSRILFVGGTARRVLHQIFRLNSTYFIEGNITDWGLQFDSFKIPRGNYNIVEHSLLNAYGSASSWSKMAIGLDVASFMLAYMNGRKTQNREFNMSGQPAVDNGIDAVGGSLLTEVTCLVKNPSADSILYNFTAGAAG